MEYEELSIVFGFSDRKKMTMNSKGMVTFCIQFIQRFSTVLPTTKSIQAYECR